MKIGLINMLVLTIFWWPDVQLWLLPAGVKSVFKQLHITPNSFRVASSRLNNFAIKGRLHWEFCSRVKMQTRENKACEMLSYLSARRLYTTWQIWLVVAIPPLTCCHSSGGTPMSHQLRFLYLFLSRECGTRKPQKTGCTSKSVTAYSSQILLQRKGSWGPFGDQMLCSLSAPSLWFKAF